MSVTLGLYNFKGDKKQLDKINDMVTLELISGELKADTDIINPVITIEPTATSTIAKILKETNYVHIADFGRYYFVTDIIAKPGSVLELHLAIDVLTSWSAQIKLLNEGIVLRNAEASHSNLYLDDNELHIYNKPNVVTYEFSYASGSKTFGDGCYILAVAGG